jgi:hypothetical protein
MNPKGQHVPKQCWIGSRQVCTMVYYGSLYCEHENLQTNLLEERASHYKCPSHATFQLLFKTKKQKSLSKIEYKLFHTT